MQDMRKCTYHRFRVCDFPTIFLAVRSSKDAMAVKTVNIWANIRSRSYATFQDSPTMPFF